MGSLRLVAIVLLLGSCSWGAPRSRSRRPPMAWGALRPQKKSAPWISRSVPRERNSLRATAPPRRAHRLFEQKGCIGCHGEAGIGGPAPALQSKTSQDVPIWKRERILPLRAPFATIVWDFIHRGMPLGNEGTLTADEVYALTAYLLVPEQGDPGGRSTRQRESAEGQDADWR